MASRLSRVLRGKYHDVWKQFAADIGGEYREGVRSAHDEVHFTAHGREGVLEGDLMMVMVGKIFVPVLTTRLVVLLPSVETHRFSLVPAGFGSAIARWFGAQDIAVGDETFDEAFVLKGVEPVFVQRLFADTKLRSRCDEAATFSYLQRRDDKVFWSDPTPGMDPCELKAPGLVDDPQKLRRYYDLFVDVLGRQPECTPP